MRGVGALHVDAREVGEVLYEIYGHRESSQPDSAWVVFGAVIPVSGQSWLLVDQGVIGAKASLDLRRGRVWWDCTIIDVGGTARPRDGAGLHRR